MEDSGLLSIMTETPGNSARTLTIILNVQSVHVNLFHVRLSFQCVSETWAQDCIRLMKRPKFGTRGLCNVAMPFFPV